jgi:hypothetical protein
MLDCWLLSCAQERRQQLRWHAYKLVTGCKHICQCCRCASAAEPPTAGSDWLQDLMLMLLLLILMLDVMQAGNSNCRQPNLCCMATYQSLP